MKQTQFLKGLKTFFSFKPADSELKNIDDFNGVSNTGLMQLLNSMGACNDISHRALWSWYKKVSPLRHSIDGLISPNFSTITPRIYDSVEQRFLTEKDQVDYQDVLKLLEKPNQDQSGFEMREAFAPSWFVTGNLYLMVTAIDEFSEPLEMFYIAPQSVSPIRGGNGIVDGYTLSSLRFQETFKRQELNDGSIAYVTGNGTKELKLIKSFNPEADPSTGLSPISSVVAEIEQYSLSNNHNTNFIKKGARPSGILTIPADVDLQPEQEELLRKSLENFNGANAGRVLIAQGGQNFTELGVNNKDMDYIESMKRTRNEISLALNIPLSLVTVETMTMDNFSESKYMLFDMAVCPFANRIYFAIDMWLGRRYEKDERYSIRYNRLDIEAIKIRENQKVDRVGRSGVSTVNEYRDELDLPPLSKEEGGEELFQPNGGSKSNSTNPAVQASAKDSKARVKFKHELKKLNKYTDEQIETKASHFFG